MINGDYYTALLDCFNNILKKKRPVNLAKKKMLFHQDYARIRTCPALIAKFNEFRYELLPHPAYSSDLVPCNYFLFSWRMEERDLSESSLIAKTETYFKGTNHIILTAWKSWRIVGSNVLSWKETMLRNKNESIKKNVFYYVFLKTYLPLLDLPLYSKDLVPIRVI